MFKRFTYIYSIIITIALIYGFGEIHELSNKLSVGSAWIKDTLTSDLRMSRNVYLVDSLIFKPSGNFGINSMFGGSQIIFNESNGSIDFGLRDVRVNGNYGFTSMGGINSGNLVVTGLIALTKRLLTAKGSDVASANSMTLGDGNYFNVTGTTTINNISTTSWNSGSEVTLLFTGTTTLTNKAGGSGQMQLLGNTNGTTAPAFLITFVLDGTIWYEVSRSQD